VTIEVRRVRADEAALLRDVRLRSLREAPGAFATSFEEARAWPEERWREMAATGAAGEREVTLVALDGRRAVGLVSGRLRDDLPGSAWLARLWVDPSVRRGRLGARLIDAVGDWARERGATRLDLSVTTNNTAAAAFYARIGFAETGRRRPLPADPIRTEVFLSRRLPTPRPPRSTPSARRPP
jgi:ribosomal protein S18 acetylase RimI-like enzyme